MHISYALITALLTSAVSSQTVADLVSQIPSCALLCLATSSTAASCGLADYACQCGPARAAITTSATPCILSKCSSDDAAKVLTVSGQICAAVASPATSAGAAATSAKAPVASFASSITGPVGSAVPVLASHTASAAASTTSAIRVAQVSGNAGARVQAGAAVAGVVVLAAFGL